MAGFISDADFEKNIGFAQESSRPVNFISDEDFEKKIGLAKKSEPKEPEKADSLMDKLDAFLIAGGRGVFDLGQGIKQMAIQGAEKVGLADKGSAEKYRQKVNKELERYEEIPQIKDNPMTAGAGRIASGILSTIPAGAITLPAKVGGAVARALGTGALQGGVIGAAQYDPTGDSRLENIALGAGLGAAVPAGLMGAKRLIKGKDRGVSQELGRLSEEQGVELTVPELRASPFGKYLESVSEKVPGTGYMGFREKQVGQFKNQAQNILDSANTDLNENFGSAIKSSLERTLTKNKEEAKKNFDIVQKIANERGGKVNFSNTRQQAQNLIKELTEMPQAFQDQNLINKVSRLADVENLSFEQARKLRSLLGNEVSKTKNAFFNGNASPDEYRFMNQLAETLDTDIDNFAEQSGGLLKQAYDKAKEQYKNKVIPFNDGELKQVLQANKDVDLIVGSFLKPNNRQQLASTLINNIDDKGLDAARAAILTNAFEKASKGDFFNPMIFTNEATKLGKVNKILFTPEQQKTLEGYSKLAKAAERASKFAANPETGARLAPLAVSAIAGGGAYALDQLGGMDLSKSAALILFTLGGARLFQSQAGRRLLTRAYNMPEKAKPEQWSKLLKNATQLAVPVAATQPSQVLEE